jgi:hypothetical protein
MLVFDHRPLDPGDAKDLLAAAKGLELPANGELLANAYVEADRPDDALAILRKPGRPCRDLEYVFPVVREHLWLGVALEHAGDRAGARREYEKLISYWGGAKPRSLTAENARARLDKLGL